MLLGYARVYRRDKRRPSREHLLVRMLWRAVLGFLRTWMMWMEILPSRKLISV
jgi:hypothetical protein